MPAPIPFIDSNVLVYLLSAKDYKSDIANALLRAGACISIQVLNEVGSVMRRKRLYEWHDVDEFLSLLIQLCTIEPMTLETHVRGRRLAQRYGLSLYDGQIVSAALLAGCEVLFSEDMQHGLLVENTLRIQNPFLS
jgi:predicted nucleic acid-binding protein